MTGQRFAIGVLGEFRVTRNGEPVPLMPSRKTRALLAYLALASRPQRRERLCSLLWEIPDDPRAALRWSLSKIRQVVDWDGRIRLKADRETVALDTEGIALDVAALRGLAPTGLASAETGRLEAAAAAFRGDFLEDLALPNCPEYEAWRVAEAEEKARLRVAIHAELAARLAGSDPERALVHARALGQLEPDAPGLDALLADLTRRAPPASARIANLARAPAAPDRGAAPVPPVEAAPEAPETPTVEAPPERSAQQEMRFCTAADGTRIAWAISGEGPPLVRAPHWMTHLEYDWDSPLWRPWLSALTRRHTLVRFDQRGCGLSQRGVADVSFEAMVGDLEAVVDAAGLDRFALLGISQSCATSVAYAVRHPHRVSALVLYGGYVRGWRARGDPKEIARREAMAILIREGWGAGTPMFRQLFTSMFIPGATPQQAEWYNELQARSAAPEDAWRIQNAMADIDVCHLLPKVAVPTLVLHARGDLVAPLAAGKAFAEGIPGARFVELDSANHILLKHEPAFARFLEEVEAFVETAGRRRAVPSWPGGERRTASLLAVDLVSPLAALDSAIGDLGEENLEPLLEAISDEIDRAGGEILQAGSGDLIAAFGLDGATEDHSRAAARAALAALRIVREISEDTVRARVAVDLGEVVVRRQVRWRQGHPSVSGAPVNRVRSLVHAQRREGILMTARAAQAAGGAIRTAVVRADDLPSIPRDVAVVRLVGENRALSRWLYRAGQGLSPIAGREAELLLLTKAVRSAAEGRGRVVGVTGDAGIGKSRLVHEFLASPALEGFTIAEAGAEEGDAAVPFCLLGKLVRALAFIEPHHGPDETRARLDARLTAVGAPAPIAGPLSFVLDLAVADPAWKPLGAAERAERLRRAVCEFVALIARRERLALLLEDLHWTDEESLCVIASLFESVPGLACLVVATWRPHARPLPGELVQSQLHLDPLDRTSAASLLGGLLGPDPSVRALEDPVLDATAGVPLLIEETVNDLAERGVITGRRGAYKCRKPPKSVPVPAGAVASIGARVARLGPEHRRVLEIASAIGSSAPLALVEELAALPGDIGPLLDDLRRADLLYESAPEPQRIVSFKHALVREAVYATLTREARIALHTAILDALERREGANAGERVEQLAEHAERAGAWQRAAHHLLAAARRALERAANASALSICRRVEEALVGVPEGATRNRLELAMRKVEGVALMATRGWGADEVLAAFLRAEELAGRLGDESETFEILRGRGQYYMISGRCEAARDMARRCARLVAGREDDELALECAHMTWTNSLLMGRYDEVAEQAATGERIYRADVHHALTFRYSGHDPGVCCRLFGALADQQQGRQSRAGGRIAEALALAGEFGHPLTEALAYWGASSLALLADDPESALGWAERVVGVCDRHLLPLLRSQGEFQAGWAIGRLEGPERGITRMLAGIEGIRATGAEMGLPYYLALLGEALAGAGETDRALAALDEAHAGVMRNGAALQFSEILRIRASVLARAGETPDAATVAILEKAVASAREQNAPVPELRAADALAELLARLRRREEAEAAAAHARRLRATLSAASGADAARHPA